MHTPVMLENLKNFLNNKYFNSIIDCTYGFGGHNGILKQYTEKIISIDRDIDVVQNNSHVIHSLFSNLDKIIDSTDLIFADLGLSNMQINGQRGFSFMNNSPLLMTMGLNNNVSAQKILNEYNFTQLVNMFHNGQCTNSNVLAKKIIAFRLHSIFTHSDHVKEALQIYQYKTLAKIFQAIRIEVNNEFHELKSLIQYASKNSKYLLIITFQSLEENIIMKMVKKHIIKIELPTTEEISQNPQSRSAKLFIMQF